MTPKPITYAGWDTPPTERLTSVRSFAEQAPKVRGVDGFVVQAVRRGQPNNLLNVFVGDWTADDFANSQPGGRWLWSRGLNPSGAPIRWEDDKRWEVIADNFFQLSGLAVRLGCQGVLLDMEHHGPAPCLWQAQRSSDWTAAYLRGVQVGEQMRNRTFAFHRALSFLSDLLPLPGGGVLEKRPPTLEQHKYGLLAKFIAGLSSYHNVVDFCGTNQARTPSQVFEESAALRNLPNLLQQDYSRVKFGSSLYLDRFTLKTDADKRPIVRCAPESFRAMVDAYYRVSETDLLLYGEWGRLCEPNGSIHAAPNPYPLWTDAIPAFSDCLQSVTEPERFARETQRESVLGEWRFGVADHLTRLVFFETPTPMVIGVGSGWFYQSLPVSPGESFAARGHIASTSTAWLGCRWQDAAGAWIDPLTTRRFYAGSDGIAAGVVVAPAGAAKLVVTLAVEHEREVDRTTFRDAKVCRVNS